MQSARPFHGTKAALRIRSSKLLLPEMGVDKAEHSGFRTFGLNESLTSFETRLTTVRTGTKSEKHSREAGFYGIFAFQFNCDVSVC